MIFLFTLILKTTVQYIYIALTIVHTVQYGIYCTGGSLDPPTHQATNINTVNMGTRVPIFTEIHNNPPWIWGPGSPYSRKFTAIYREYGDPGPHIHRNSQQSTVNMGTRVPIFTEIHINTVNMGTRVPIFTEIWLYLTAVEKSLFSTAAR